MSSWQQLNVRFSDWGKAEHTAATGLAPLLQHSSNDGLIKRWFFVRKFPCWRVRYLPADASALAVIRLQACLTELIASGHVIEYQNVIYEPETHAFGGPGGMDAAHRLFHDDSRHLLTTHHLGEHRRERAVLLCCILLRSAGLDWYEQGDVWARVAEHRPPDRPLPHERICALSPTLRQLMQAQNSPLLADTTWSASFVTAGCQLADLSASGRLRRGLRAVLAHHVIFTWNRHGLPYATQATLARTAQHTVFGPDPGEEPHP